MTELEIELRNILDEKEKKDGDASGKKYSTSSVHRVLAFLYPYRVQVFWLLFMTMTMAILAAVPPAVTKYLVDEVFTRGNTEHFFLY